MRIPKQTKKLKFDLSTVPRHKRIDVRNEIGKTIVNEILRFTKGGKSPVSGESFKKLSINYADDKKGGNRTPNLRLSRDMTKAIEFKTKGINLEVGIFKSGEKGKADGHNNFSGLSSLPKRRFIPQDDQNFKRDINTKINKIINEHKISKPIVKIKKDREDKKKDLIEIGQVDATLDLGFDLDDFILQEILGIRNGQ